MKIFLPFLLFFKLQLLSCGGNGNGSSNGNQREVTQETPQAKVNPLEEVQLLTPQGERILASLAYTPEDQQRGLSNVRSDEFSERDGKLFFYLSNRFRTFWMPETFFDLDVFYLDEDLNILEIVRDLPSFPGGPEDPDVPRAPRIYSRHVLEMKSSSEIADNLKVGDQLRWDSPWTLQRTESEIRRRQ